MKLGALTLNEMRSHLGLDPYANTAADRPMVLTSTGYVPIEAGAGGEGAKPPEGGAPNANASNARAIAKHSLLKDFDPNQPRVPAGNPDGGQWASESGSGGSNDPRVISDATSDNTWIPGAQYAGGIEEDENRIRGEPNEGTPAQEARLEVAQARWQQVLSQVQAVDPKWKPTPGLYETIEGNIANLEAQAQEAQSHLSELATFGIGPGPFAGESITARGPERDFTDEEREQINQIGAETGCHTCGTTEPGTSSGNFVVDHQLPNALNRAGQAQRLYPQCISCSYLQGGWVCFLSRTR